MSARPQRKTSNSELAAPAASLVTSKVAFTGGRRNIATISPNRVNRAHWPTKENMQNFNIFCIFRPLEKLPEMAPNGAGNYFFPTNLNLGNILGMTDFDFDKFHFSGFCRSQISQISKFLGRASSILLQYLFCHR